MRNPGSDPPRLSKALVTTWFQAVARDSAGPCSRALNKTPNSLGTSPGPSVTKTIWSNSSSLTAEAGSVRESQIRNNTTQMYQGKLNILNSRGPIHSFSHLFYVSVCKKQVQLHWSKGRTDDNYKKQGITMITLFTSLNPGSMLFNLKIN